MKPIRRMTLIHVLACTAAALGHEKPEQPLVTVTGTGEVRVAPDEVSLGIVVRTLDVNIAKSSEQTAEKVKRVLEIASAHGIAEKDMRTDQVSIRPEYDYSQNNERKFRGYHSSQTIAMTLRDVSKYQPLVTGLLQGAVDEVPGIQWGCSKAKELRADARRMAVRAAREKAQALAEALGQSIGPAHAITEDAWAGGDGVMNAMMSNVTMTSDANSTSEGGRVGLAPGEISITARVTVTFELLRPRAEP